MENFPETAGEDPESKLDLPPPVKKPATSPTHSSQHADTDTDQDAPGTTPDPAGASTDPYGAPHSQSAPNDPGEIPVGIPEVQVRPFIPAVSTFCPLLPTTLTRLYFATSM